MDVNGHQVTSREPAAILAGSTAADIATRAQAELARERDLLRTLLDYSPDYIYFKDLGSRFLRCSKSLSERFGLRAEELIGKSDFDLYTEEHARPAFEDEQKIIRTGEPVIGKIEREVWKQGEIMWVLTSKMPLRNKSGEVIGTFGLTKDITAIKEAEGKLAYEQELLQTLLRTIPDYLYFKDTESKFVRASNSLAQMLLVGDPDSLKGRTEFDFYPENNARPAFEDEQNIIRTGEPVLGKTENHLRKDGQKVWVLTTKLPWRDKDGGVIGTFGISKDITAIKEAEGRLEQAHRQLLESSRLAGMAEVATSVLHNVGNVLNSVNVSCSVVSDKVRKSKVASISKVAALIQEHKHDLPGFFAKDPKGAQLAEYLGGLAEHLSDEREQILLELQSLSDNIDHIKEIVAMQQSYSKVSGVRELLAPKDLVEDAIRMNGAALERHHIKIIREYSEVPNIVLERHKVLQILINLLRNAKYACDEVKRPDKRITLRLAIHDGDKVRIMVIDNGIGIPPENLTRIFEHGFTTRKEGHGFGLHSGALAAREMGGSLTVQSAGLEQGANFILEFPCSHGRTTT
jgi:PAS domain S-box-containing protein